jgi:hypothetical protein
MIANANADRPSHQAIKTNITNQSHMSVYHSRIMITTSVLDDHIFVTAKGLQRGNKLFSR